MINAIGKLVALWALKDAWKRRHEKDIHRIIRLMRRRNAIKMEWYRADVNSFDVFRDMEWTVKNAH